MLAVPQFYVTPRQRFTPGSILLATIIAFACVLTVLYCLAHSRHGHPSGYAPESGRDGFSLSSNDEDDDDPSRGDTIYLGDPSDAPTPTRPGSHVTTVHPFVVVHLPRSGNQVGQIPALPPGRPPYSLPPALHRTDPSALAKALPTQDPDSTEAAQVELQKQTGGFTLLSAKEVTPGVLVFRLHDQTPAATEVLGTVQVNSSTNPATIASFSLRAVSQPPAKAH